MTSIKQSGFSAVTSIVAIVLVIGVLGFIGWRVYNQPSKQTDDATSNTSNTNSQPSKESSTPTTTTTKPTYLDIKELGIKIQLSDNIKDAVYSVVPTTDGSKGVGISAQSLVDKSSDCKASNFTLGLIEATTTAPTYVGGQKPLPIDNKTLFKFGDTYYWYRQPQAPACLSDNQADNNLVGNKVNAFTQAFTTLQLDQ